MNEHPMAIWRTKSGLTQIQLGIKLAKKLKMDKPIPQKTIFAWENGTTPRVDVAEAIEILSKGAVPIGIWKKHKIAKKVID